MNPALLGVLVAGGVVLVEDEPKVTPRVPTPKPGTGTVTPDPTAPRSYAGIRLAAKPTQYAPGTGVGSIPNSTVTTKPPLVYASPATTASGMDAETEAAIRARLEEEYNALSGEAKRAACERLKDQFPDDSNVQALDCANADFQKVLNVVGAAIGTAVCGPACGALGVLAAQYFGEDINQLWNDYVADVWNAPADHDTETLSLAQACARGDAATKAYLKQQAISRGIKPPPECG